MQTLISRLLEEAESNDVKAQGVPEGFLDGLERVDKKRLKKEDVCCICNSSFLDGKSHPVGKKGSEGRGYDG